MILVDTNVLSDLVTDDPVWAMWSIEQLESAAIKSPVLIHDVISAELAARYGTIEKLNAFAAEAEAEAELTHVSMPKSALFLAGQVFTRYRRAGRQRSGVLPDFFIGAHAAVEGLSLLTRDRDRDRDRYRRYFPKLHLISPIYSRHSRLVVSRPGLKPAILAARVAQGPCSMVQPCHAVHTTILPSGASPFCDPCSS